MNETERMPDETHRDPADNPILDADFDDDGVLCLTLDIPGEGPRRGRVINPELLLGPAFAGLGADPSELLGWAEAHRDADPGSCGSHRSGPTGEGQS